MGYLMTLGWVYSVEHVHPEKSRESHNGCLRPNSRVSRNLIERSLLFREDILDQAILFRIHVLRIPLDKGRVQPHYEHLVLTNEAWFNSGIFQFL